MNRCRRPRISAAIATLIAIAATGCGVGPGKAESGGAELIVTRDFGQEQLGEPASREDLRESDTVLRFLQSERKVRTRFGGGFVQSIDGLNGSKAGEHDWFYYVNGSEPSVGSGDYALSEGDVVQWDFHRWTATQHVPAIVGAFPEPFVHGFEGKRVPTRLECDDDDSDACRTARDSLLEEDVVVTSATLGTATEERTLRVVVAKWSEARQLVGSGVLEQGPAQSGVFARFSESGDELTLLDGSGKPARTAPPGTGLLAATQPDDRAITWIVTGLDDEGVARAAEALDPDTLRGAFAVAATPEGLVKLPVGGD